MFTLPFRQSQFRLMLTTSNSIFLACLYENYDPERKRELLIRVSLTEATTDLERFYLKLSGDYSKAFQLRSKNLRWLLAKIDIQEERIFNSAS